MLGRASPTLQQKSVHVKLQALIGLMFLISAASDGLSSCLVLHVLVADEVDFAIGNTSIGLMAFVERNLIDNSNTSLSVSKINLVDVDSLT